MMTKVKIIEDVIYENNDYTCKFIKGNFLARYDYYTYECIVTNKITGKESKCTYIEINTLKWWLNIYGFGLEELCKDD